MWRGQYTILPTTYTYEYARYVNTYELVKLCLKILRGISDNNYKDNEKYTDLFKGLKQKKHRQLAQDDVRI